MQRRGREEDDAHIKLRMPLYLIKGIRTKGVDDSAGQYIVTLLFHIKSVAGERKTNQKYFEDGQ